MLRRIALSLLFGYQATSALADIKVIDVDIAVVGGGAGGAYAAVRLREDLNTSIVLIEPKDHLGGHVSTYTVPETNTTFEYGVQSYIRNSAAIDFFARFGVATQPFAAKRLTAINVDVETGKQLKDYIAPALNATTEALKRWLAIVSKYESQLEPGYFNFPKPEDIPAEFLVPVEEFVKLHQLDAAIPRILAISGVGYGGIRNLLTFNLMQAFGASLTRQFLDNQLVQPLGSNSLVYQRALALLRPDVLLSSTVQAVQRSSNGARVTVKQGDKQYQINAKRILYTAPASLAALAPYDLDDQENKVFSTWATTSEIIGVAKIPCIPENVSVSYIPSAAVPANQVALKDWPYSLRLDSTGPTGLSLFRVILGANYTLSTAEFTSILTSSVTKLQDAGTVTGKCSVEIKATSDHTRPVWKQSKELMQAGFVQDLYALQGKRGIWYTGNVWAAPYSSTVWAYTDEVLERMLADIKGEMDV
jgi:predicted NAD/FAD-dependent oxidoreductase